MHDQLQTLENDALRAKLGLDKKAGRAWSSTSPTATTPAYPLKKWDVITKIGDHEVDNVGHGQGPRQPPAPVPVLRPDAGEGRQGRR